MALTLRLSDQEQVELNRIQRLLGHSTGSGCIKHLIMKSHVELEKRWSLQDENEKLKNKVWELTNLIINFVEADKRRNQLLTEMKEI